MVNVMAGTKDYEFARSSMNRAGFVRLLQEKAKTKRKFCSRTGSPAGGVLGTLTPVMSQFKTVGTEIVRYCIAF